MLDILLVIIYNVSKEAEMEYKDLILDMLNRITKL